MTLKIYQVDAFHHEVFKGNPAAVVPLITWLPDERLQAIAMENNLSETAFFLPEENGIIPLRWFTPAAEVRLCGHATLATAHVLFHENGYHPEKALTFSTQSGLLHVKRTKVGYQMDFPADTPRPIPTPPYMNNIFGTEPETVLQGLDDILVIFPSETAIRQAKPNISALKEIETRGVLISAPGDEFDFVSRCFFPRYGVDEDPVTGSAHTLMAPYWAKRLQKNTLSAAQISHRGGLLTCTFTSDRVLLDGQAVTYMRGEIYLN